MHFSDRDRAWVDPRASPIMFDVLHFLYTYFLAIEDGDLEPMLDFLINGEYDPKFVKAVKEGYYEDDVPLDQGLYLYWKITNPIFRFPELDESLYW